MKLLKNIYLGNDNGIVGFQKRKKKRRKYNDDKRLERKKRLSNVHSNEVYGDIIDPTIGRFSQGVLRLSKSDLP